MLRVVETLRLYALVFSLPYTYLWAKGLDIADGPLLIAAHACLALFFLTLSARIELERGIAPRLGLVRSRESVDADLIDHAMPVLTALTLGLSLALLIANFWIGLGALLAMLLSVWIARQSGREKYVLLELVAPAVLLVGPAMLFRARAWSPPKTLQVFGDPPPHAPEATDLLAGTPVGPVVVTQSALAASCLGGVMLATLILLAMLRDREADLAEGVDTTATRLGRAGCAALIWCWTIALVTLASMGAGWGWWHWSAAAIAAVTALVTLNALTRGWHGWSTGLALAGYATTSAILGVTTT